VVPGIPASTLGGLDSNRVAVVDGAIPPVSVYTVVQSTASSSFVMDQSDACSTQGLLLSWLGLVMEGSLNRQRAFLGVVSLNCQ
jgi:hypothetical protein